MVGIEEALAQAVTLLDEIKRRREQSSALRALMRKEGGSGRALIWQARNYRTAATYARLLARVRAGAPGTRAEPPDADHLRGENRRLSHRIRELETLVAKLCADREAFFDAFGRYVNIERLIAKPGK